MTDEVTPLASPTYIRENGPFDTVEELLTAKLIKSPLEPCAPGFWRMGWTRANRPRARPSTTSA
jgi:LysR family glycine cleavage system transcriptional activator